MLGLACLCGCEQSNEPTYQPQLSDQSPIALKQYIFGVHPLHNPNRLHQVFGPLMDYLSQRISYASFRLEASRNYAAFDDKLYSGHFDFALPNPYQTVNAIAHGYRVFGKMGDDHNFRGIILVRKDSGIRSPRDLRGKAVSFPAPTALAGTMLPQYYLKTHGVDLSDIKAQYVGSQESSIMNVFLGDVAAGATWPPLWQALAKERPELERELVVKWETQSLPNNGLVARKDIPDLLVQQVTAALVTLHEHPKGYELLYPMGLSRFERASDETFAPVRDFIRQFEALVRPAS